MKSSLIRGLIVLAVISILGIIAVQGYWFNKAFDTEEDIFNREVNAALFNVASQFFKLDSASTPAGNPIRQLSTNYYVVTINDEIDANLLEYLLKMEFEKRDIEADFEYGIYDCTNDKMVYGNYVSLNDETGNQSDHSLPKWENQNYYFGVQFPNKAAIITDRMGVWIFSTSVLMLVIIFFAYSLFVILKQKRLSEIQKDFINNMTHEFKTPIATIAVSADVLSQPDIITDPERMAQYTDIIKKENTRLKNQVERVLQMADLDHETMTLNRETINMHDIIHEVTSSIYSANTGITLTHHLQAEDYSINGDRLHLSNAIGNLIDNAIKYSKAPADIVISTANKGRKLIIRVQDHGIGMDRSHLKRIFQKFYRIPTGNVHDVKGFGLGLSYVQQVVSAHRGTIEAESTPGEGSTFTLTFNYA